jgi:PAS domain S-box-containing protein
MVNVLSETGLSNLKLVRDITKRKDIETALRESEQQFRTLTENSPNIIVRYDRECRRVYANPAYSLETGIPSDQAQNAVLTTQWRPDISMPVEEYKSRLRQVMETGIPADIILEWRRPDTGMISSHIFNAVAELDQDGQVIGCLAIGHNISDRKKAEQLLHAKREQLASVARELSIAEERERLRIASVLHDHIGQILLLGRIKLGALADISKPAPVKSVIDEVIDLLDQATDDAHSLTVQLCPPMLSVSGLEAALQWLGKRMESDYGIVVEFSDDLRPKPLGDELRSILYQCARELLINTAKHANTDRAWLIVERKDDMYRLTVEDRGTGFNPDDISPDITKDYRFGLFSIQVRIEFLGGHMEIESHLAVGTRITILLPVKT